MINFVLLYCVSKWQCINPSYSIMHYIIVHQLCHQHKPHGTYVLCKQRWQNFQYDYMDKTLPCFKLFLVLCLLCNNVNV